MNAALLALEILCLPTQQTAVAAPLLPGALLSGTPHEAPSKKPVLLGEATAAAILAHRAVLRDNLAKVKLSPALKARWKAVRQPFTLVAVFGSWCGDSHRQLPDLLALDADPNPFIEVHYLGVKRDKALAATTWPKGCTPQQVARIPTFYLFATQPGGGQKLMGTVVETPPRKGQTMAQALVELLEDSAKVLER